MLELCPEREYGCLVRIIIIILTGVTAMMLSACGGQSWYETSYRSVVDHSVNSQCAYMLAPDAKPQLFLTNAFQEDLKIFTDQKYIVVGESFFTGPLEKTKNAVAVGEEIGVTHVLLEADYLYMGSKKAYKFYKNYDYLPVPMQRNGVYYYGYEAVPNPISVPYQKEIPIYKQRAVYLVKLK